MHLIEHILAGIDALTCVGVVIALALALALAWCDRNRSYPGQGY